MSKSSQNRSQSKVSASVYPIVFLGLAQHLETRGGFYPVHPIDLFQLSQAKAHFIYPVPMDGYEWVFLFHEDAFDGKDRVEFRIDIRSEKGIEIGWMDISLNVEEPANRESGARAELSTAQPLLRIKKGGWSLLHFREKFLLPEPGKYQVNLTTESGVENIGTLQFGYQKKPPLSREEIEAIGADPGAAKFVRYTLACNKCGDAISAYAGLGRSDSIESEGDIWQHDLPDRFQCKCKKLSSSLAYLKESLHGLLGQDMALAEISYVRRYAHSEIEAIAKSFLNMIAQNADENSVQKYLEDNPVLLAQFRARKLFKKPAVLGKYKMDFAFLDTAGRLICVELEKPATKLFRQNGHPAATLMHAYGQVKDWLNEYQKHPSAFLEGLGLKTDEVNSVRGAVIAGRLKDADSSHLKRHLMAPPYQDVDFYTCDDLALSTMQISKDLA